jgi:7-cyano-7-deazaguanine reductase
MSEVKNYQSVVEIANRHLGKVGGDGYKDQYDPSLLVKIPRYLNREGYQLTGKEFVGVDVWNAYEVSAITTKGQPVAGMLKIVCPSDSEYHVESKSIKLYLNSFNMTRIGDTAADCIQGIESRVKRDLDELLETITTVSFYTEGDNTPEVIYSGYTRIQELTNMDEVEFTAFKSDASQLESSGNQGELKVSVDFIRSNCRVTNQPDFGTMFLYMKGNDLPTLESLAKYVVSHRTVSHFHEEICEMVFAHLMTGFKPEQMMVDIHYSRRGGIDINPVRATHSKLVADFMIDPAYRMKKVLKQ